MVVVVVLVTVVLWMVVLWSVEVRTRPALRTVSEMSMDMLTRMSGATYLSSFKYMGVVEGAMFLYI